MRSLTEGLKFGIIIDTGNSEGLQMEMLLKSTRAYRLLEKECAEGNFSHAYLLTFDDRKNLRFALKTFAKLFFLKEENQKEKQRREKLIDEESFIDCLCFPQEGKRPSVEDAEKIREESTLSPVEGEIKVFLFSNFDEAAAQTQNKLLKLLEEPPKGVVFLLGATTSFPVLTTVSSRTKKLEINPFSIEEVSSCLARIYQNGYTVDEIKLCAAASGGVVGEAQKMLEDGYYKTLLEGAFSLILSEEHRLPQVVKALGETNYKKELLSLLRLIFRDALLIKMKGPIYKKEILLRSEITRVEETATKYPLSALIYAQEALSKAEKETNFNAVFPQCIEICLANIARKKNENKV